MRLGKYVACVDEIQRHIDVAEKLSSQLESAAKIV